MTNKKSIRPGKPGEVLELPDEKSHQTAGVQPGTESGEIGGPAGLEPTRYGDWEVNGRCTDF